MEKKYNLKSPAVKRLMREAMELKDPTHQYHAQPLEHDLFEWHFTVRGPPDTEFEGGQYHGRITFPAEYPMKPPNIILLTPNGRFEVGKKICLSMSAHHPETWQPSWSLRTVLLALIGFMPTKGAGAIGALDYTPEERKVLAGRSKDWKCNVCGMDHHSCLLEADPANSEHERQEVEEAKELATQLVFKGETEKERKGDSINQSKNENIVESNIEELVASQANNLGVTQNDVNEPDTILRQRIVTTETTQENLNSTDSFTITEQTNVTNRTTANSVADFLSLILLWIVAVLLVVLILKRLASETTSISKSNY